MASKRKPLTFAELDNLKPEPKGRARILRSLEEVEAEQQLAASEVEELSFGDTTPSPSTKAEMRNSAKAELSNSTILQMSNSAKAVKAAAVRTTYAKASYRMHPDAFDAILDAKRLLRRQFNLAVSLEEIAEKAILVAYNDLVENGESSNLVRALRDKEA